MRQTNRWIPAAFAITILAVTPAVAETTERAIDFQGFLEQSAAAAEARQTRLLAVEDFLALAAEPGAVLLDARSESAYAAKHLAGAVSLPLSDMTEESLLRVIGDRRRTVLIYCNNNFVDDAEPFLTKAPPAALNIPTFATLWIYGYRDVYELGEVLETSDRRLRFEGASVDVAAP